MNTIKESPNAHGANRKTAIIVGILYLIANIAGPISFSFALPIQGAPDYLANISANENRWLMGVLFELIMAIGVAGIGFALYPVLRKQNESIAIGYVGARIVEFVIFIIGVISSLLLLTLSHEYMQAGAPDASYFQTLGELLLATRDWGGHVVLDLVVFPLAALILNYTLYKSKLIPRWLSVWGLIGAILYWIPSLLVMFALIIPLSPVHVGLQAPLGLQEMVFAVWLIVKGFNPSAITSLPAKAATNELLSAA